MSPTRPNIESAFKATSLALVGLVVFLVTWGTVPLDVKNDAWIMPTYAEADIWAHYVGWLGFRNSPWTFPIGLASELGVGEGTLVTFTDSIPLAAILFKLFRNTPPETFQYFGIYMLLCYVLQAVAGYKLIWFKTKDAPVSAMGATLLCFSPVMMERAFRHTALASHWLILFAILVWQKHRAQYRQVNYFWFSLLLSLAIGIHPYIIPMVAIFMLLAVIDDLRRSKYVSILLCASALAATYLCGWIIGALGTGVDSEAWGFGFFSMNLNALFNPLSLAGFSWSIFFKTHPQILGHYDGFNYIGAGVIAGLLLSLALFLCFPPGTAAFKEWGKRNSFFAAMMLGCTIFSVSNVIAFNDTVLFTLPLPHMLTKICNTFRASSRFFYPVYYCIFTGIIITIWKREKKIGTPRARLLVALILFLQVLDIHPAIAQMHQHMNASRNFQSALDDAQLNDALRASKYVIAAPPSDEWAFNTDLRTFAIAALKNRKIFYCTMGTRPSHGISLAKASDVLASIKRAGNIGPHLIVTSDPTIRNTYLKLKDVTYLKRGKLYYIYSNSSQ